MLSPTRESELIVSLAIITADPAKIKRTSSSGIVYPPGIEAKLFCEVDGSPIGDEYVTWQKVGSNPELPGRYSTSFVNRTSYLHIEDPSQEDVGEYRCKVNNGIGNVTSDPILFITNCTYEFVLSLTAAPSVVVLERGVRVRAAR